MSETTVRPMTRRDVPAVVGVHVAAFPRFFLTFLGPRFLAVLYRGVLEDESGLAFVAESGGRCVGFVAGTVKPARFYARLLRRRLVRFGLAAVPALLRRPAVLPRLLRAFAKPAESAPDVSGRAELMSLGVEPESQGSGAGRLLTEAFVAAACARGAVAVILTTDADGNDAVNRFYERRGFVRMRTFTTPERRRMFAYERLCIPGAEDGGGGLGRVHPPPGPGSPRQ